MALAKTRMTDPLDGEQTIPSVPAEPVGSPEPLDRLQVYAGPTMHRRVMIAGSVYKNGLPEHVKDLIRKVPDVGRIIVPVKDFPAVRKETETPGTEYHRIYNALLEVRFDDGEVRI